MASTEEIFPVFDASEIANTEVESTWNYLISALNGSSFPASVIDQFPALEPALLDYYCQEMCVYSDEFFKSVDLQTADAEFFAALIQELHIKFLSPLAKLPFTKESHAVVQKQLTALLRDFIDEEQHINTLLDYLGAHSFDSSQAVEVLTQYHRTGNLDVETEAALAIALPRIIHEMVERHFKDQWQRSVLDECVSLVQDTVLPVLTAVGIYDGELREQLHHLAREKLAEVRLSELFDMILHEGESQPGLSDLKEVVHTPELRAKTVSTLQQSCNTRLLNSGVDTSSIILFCWGLVSVLSELDPRGVVLDKVSPAIHRYLKERPDTVGIIVDGIIGEESSPLAKLSEKLAPPSASDLAIENDMLNISWQPDPVDAPPDFVKRQTRDIVSTFFMLYDNPEVYIKRLNSVFSSKLLNVRSLGELAELTGKAESLKKRFGQRQLQSIYVMIRDVRKSLRMQERVRAANQPLESTKALILSHRYWLNLKNERGNFPQSLQHLADQYCASFERYYPQRAVFWSPEDSRVSVKLEFEDRTLDLIVTPDQAAIINCFSEASHHKTEYLSAVVGIDQKRTVSALQFWTGQGALAGPDENDTYTVVERAASTVPQDVDIMLGESSSSKKAAEEMMVYWQYIVGMLTNLGSLPADKIHSFLVMFVPKDDPYVKTKQELEQFLHHMVDEEKLVESEGNFSLKKN